MKLTLGFLTEIGLMDVRLYLYLYTDMEMDVILAWKDF